MIGNDSLRDSWAKRDRIWLRWYDAAGNWILTPEERERQRLERERRRVERLAEQLRSLGVEPDLDDEV